MVGFHYNFQRLCHIDVGYGMATFTSIPYAFFELLTQTGGDNIYPPERRELK